MFEHSSIDKQQYKEVSACEEQRFDGPAVDLSLDLLHSTTPKTKSTPVPPGEVMQTLTNAVQKTNKSSPMRLAAAVVAA